MTSNLALLSSCLLLAASPVAMAQSTSNQQTNRASGSNAASQTARMDFVEKAAIGNMMEIQLGKLAEQKSSNGPVKSFAQDLVDDHQAAQTKLERQSGAGSLPTRLDSEHQQMIDKAKNATGADFDRQFVRMQIDAHQDGIEAYQDYADQGSDPALKRYAENLLPTLRDHLRTAQALQNGSGVQAPNAQDSRGQNGGRAPVVTVRQGQPEVRVDQREPQIIVRQAPPHVTIEQPQPEIIVKMPEPDVNVQRSRPQVSVQMPQPRVNVVNQGNPDDNIDINRAQKPQVRYEPSGQPQVTYSQAQGQPRVRYEDMNGNAVEGDTSASTTSTSARRQTSSEQSGQNPDVRATSSRTSSTHQTAASRVASTNVGRQPWNDDWAAIARTRANAGDDGTRPTGRAQQMRVGKLLDLSLYNAQGDDLGDVDQIVLNTDDNRRYLVLASGGFLGLFEDRVAIPLERVRYENGRLIIHGLSEDEIDRMQDWQRRIPHRRVLNSNDMASVVQSKRS